MLGEVFLNAHVQIFFKEVIYDRREQVNDREKRV